MPCRWNTRAAPLRQSRHGALEGVAVQVRERRQEGLDAHTAGLGLGVGDYRSNAAVIADPDQDIACPAILEKRRRREYRLHGHFRVDLFCLDIIASNQDM